MGAVSYWHVVLGRGERAKRWQCPCHSGSSDDLDIRFSSCTLRLDRKQILTLLRSIGLGGATECVLPGLAAFDRVMDGQRATHTLCDRRCDARSSAQVCSLLLHNSRLISLIGF